MQGVWDQFLVKKLRSHMLHAVAKKQKIKRMTKDSQAKVFFGLERGQDPSQLHLRMKTLSAEGTSQSIAVVKARVSLQTGERTCPAKAREEAEERRPS